MGDSRRFSIFADLVAGNWPQTNFVCDVAGGKGLLQSALRERGFEKVISWDRRNKYAKGHRARFFKYGLFDYQSAPRDYDLVIGMHPDGGTDHIVKYAIKHKKPFCVCPCCVIPSAEDYNGGSGYAKWCDHLIRMAERANFNILTTLLPMKGRNIVILGRPSR